MISASPSFPASSPRPARSPWSKEQFARLRPLNDLVFAGAAAASARSRRRNGGGRVEPRLPAFLAHAAALGLLTVKGMVEQLDDPLLYSDDELIEGLARIFAAAAQ